MKTVCIYHSIDLDGWMSAAIVKHWYINGNDKINGVGNTNRLDFIGYNYGQPIPDLSEYDKVIMVDISFPKKEMTSLYNRLNENFIWLDHHISAINDNIDVNGRAKGERAIEFAACEITWMYFFPNEEMPEIVRLLGRYDCFGHKPQWKAVNGYEGIYEVSSYGKVRSLDRIIIEDNTNKSKHLQGKELSAAISKRDYLVVNLYKNNIGQLRNVHDLVARAFIPNPTDKPTVNHKDSNRLNCNITNLEWNSYEENNIHSINSGDRGFPVSQYNKQGTLINTFDSIIMAERETGIASQNIGKVCKGERDSAGGFRWQYDIKKSTPQFIPVDEEQKVLEFQYGARQCISNYEEAYHYLNQTLTIPDIRDRQNVVKTIHNQGKAIYQYLCTEAKQTYKNGFEILLDEFIPYKVAENHFNESHITKRKFICINKERFNPINFGIDYHKDGYDGAACFHRTSNGDWAFSLYNDNGEIDCSIIAKQYGGGGHKGASGFITDNINSILNLQ